MATDEIWGVIGALCPERSESLGKWGAAFSGCETIGNAGMLGVLELCYFRNQAVEPRNPGTWNFWNLQPLEAQTSKTELGTLGC